jgi:hypothetical protein
MQRAKSFQDKLPTILDRRWYRDSFIHILMEVAQCPHRLTEGPPSCRLK